MVKKIISKQLNNFISSLILIIAISSAGILIWLDYQKFDQTIDSMTADISQIVIKQNDLKNTGDQEKPDELDQKPDVPVVKPEIKMSLKSGGYYYGPYGDQLGVGPLPPKIDVQTSYWIFWEIESFNRNLEDIIITADLPENIIWTGQKNLLAGSLQYGEVTRKIAWQVDKINKTKGAYRVGFEIGLIPTQNDLGKIMDLLVNIEYTASDETGQLSQLGTLNNITTDLEFDILAADKGIVESFE